MQVNAIPATDLTDNPTGCCPRFKPAPWEGQTLHFEHKPFVRASTISFLHMPLNMGHMFKKTWAAIEAAHAATGAFLVLSHDTSPWHAEHLFAVDADVPGADMVHLSGDFECRVFEGDFSEMRRWCDVVAADVAARGRSLVELYFYYTTCPSCAKVYGKNYVVAVAQVR